MRSRKVDFRLTWRVYDELQRLSDDAGYKNVSRFLKGLCLKAIQDDRRKTWVRDIANADPKLQDFLIDKMLSWPTDTKRMIEVMRKIGD